MLRVLESKDRVKGLTHQLYRYPARFSPAFARAAILAFTSPGDLVLDPFVGGGTSLVESIALGRQVIGSDLNELAVFVSKTKTTLLGERESRRLAQWGEQIDTATTRYWHHALADVRESVDSRVPWHIKRSLQLAVEYAMELPTPRLRRVARASLLRLGQWALDGRREVPNRRQFLAKHAQVMSEAIKGSLELGSLATAAFATTLARAERQCRVYRAPAEDLSISARLGENLKKPSLVLTSPPYHGIHMLYHRWQVGGRRETNAPYWVSGCKDGRAASYYTFGPRDQAADLGIRQEYFDTALRSFRRIRSVCDEGTIVVQLVGFSNPRTQLTRYRTMMQDAGFDEVRSADRVGSVTRTVPNRKWYLEALNRCGPSEREFLLIHRARA